MSKADHAVREPAFEIRMGQVGLAQVRIRVTDAEVIYAELATRLAAAPQLFERTAVCLDLSALAYEPEAPEVRAVLDAIRRAGMLPVGLARGTERLEVLARALDLPLLNQYRAQTRSAAPVPPPSEQPVVVTAPAAVPAPAAPPPDTQAIGAAAQMHHRPVRSGQRVYARHRDLVVTNTVGAGAEVMADGCVHIYGTLRGRALAGARGEVAARVFCQEFHAELVSIAGVFRVFETIPKELAGKPVQAWLDGEDLHFARIGG
jgi:septum site-determining protein MinC